MKLNQFIQNQFKNIKSHSPFSQQFYQYSSSKQQKKQIPQGLDYEQTKQHWAEFSFAYSEKIAPNMSPAYISMLNMLEIEKSDSILETAVGSAYLVPHLISRKKNSTPLYLTDISDTILSIAQKRLELLSENKIEDLYSFSYQDLKPFTSAQQYSRFNTHLMYSNGEELTEFKDNSIQTYISSMCLQLTTDPEKMIKEAYRVLKPGGKACFSLFGSKEKSTQIFTVPKILIEHGVKMPRIRSYFHLSDKEKLMKIFENEGFENSLCWNQFLPFSTILDEASCEQYLKFPVVKDQIECADDSIKEELLKKMKKAYMDIINIEKTAIGIDALIISVQKPK